MPRVSRGRLGYSATWICGYGDGDEYGYCLGYGLGYGFGHCPFDTFVLVS